MDEMDITSLIQSTDMSRDERRLVTLDIETGVPAASTIKTLFGLPVVEPVKRKISREQQNSLDAAWAKRVEAYRRLKDNDDPRKVKELKNAYFSAIEDLKRLHGRIYG